MGQSPCEPGDSKILGSITIGDRRENARHDECKRGQKADVAFTKTFAIGDFG
jgi:hypothetical protein